MAKSKVDPIFAAYARTAPLEDLRAYLRYAERRLTEYQLPEQTVAVMREMAALELQLRGVDGTPALKARVWALVARLKESIPDYAGDPWRYGARLERWQRRAHGRASVAAVRRAYIAAVAPVAAVDALGRVRLRPAPLTVEQLDALVRPVGAASYAGQQFDTAGAQVRVEAKRAVRQRETVTTLRARVAQLEAELRQARAEAADRQVGKRHAVASGGRAAVDWKAAGRKAWETRQRRLAEQRAAQQQEGAAA